jgi:ACS family pantothenate transporter-like MFS transporter
MASRSDNEIDAVPEKGNAKISIAPADEEGGVKRSWRRRAAAVMWDSLDKSPAERRFLSKLDWWYVTLEVLNTGS